MIHTRGQRDEYTMFQEALTTINFKRARTVLVGAFLKTFPKEVALACASLERVCARSRTRRRTRKRSHGFRETGR